MLPYAKDLQAVVTEELERAVYLQLTERECKIAGWLLSTGTLRIVALLALLRHPKPPPLIVIEEIENGLDLRTIYLIVEEIRKVVESGKSQIIVTTHSPYFLDLLRLEHIVLVERDKTGQPIFTRPADQNELENWAERFTQNSTRWAD
ncbi:MAG: AAA family ATPase [Pseudomonadota bacterium]